MWRLLKTTLQDLMMFYHFFDLCPTYLQLAHSGKMLVKMSKVDYKKNCVSSVSSQLVL
jgi:hypothetical protein